MSRHIDDQKVLELATGETPLSNVAIGELLGFDEASVRRAKRRLEKANLLSPTHLVNSAAADDIILDKPLIVRDENAMITADWHIPMYDPGYVNEMIERARDLEITTLVVAGDFFNFDALSQYDPKQDSANLERELWEGKNVMRILGDTFDRIIYVWGNHDARLHRALGYKMQFTSAMRMVFGELGADVLGKLEFTNLDHVWFEFSDQATPWYICHPQSYSRMPLSNPQRLAAKYNAHVICAHSHHAAVGYATDGEKIVAEGGGFFDRKRTQYLQRSTTFPNWQQGYGWFHGGRFHLTTPDWSLA